jgi:oligopeptide/dipeptide ABC transporter ATP-binding protein
MNGTQPNLAPAERYDLGKHGRELILDARNVAVDFKVEGGVVNAVRDVSFQLHKGETIALVGESGSGKSVTARTIMRLLTKRATILPGTKITLAGRDIVSMKEDDMRKLRGNDVAMIFQEPMSSLNPVYTIGQQIVETIVRHEGVDRRTAYRRALELLEMVQIPSPERRLKAYPHEMSGGMLQRAMIAVALSCRPAVLLADEPTTALDVTVQIQVILLLRRLQTELGMAVIFVSHDVGVINEIADSVAVMYAGRFVETGSTEAVLGSPLHPYTAGLLRSTVTEAFHGRKLDAIPGMPPDLSALPTGCSFAPRCAFAEDRCRAALPPEYTAAPGHTHRCVRAADGSLPSLALPGSEPVAESVGDGRRTS